MNEHRTSQDWSRGCLVEITATVLAVLAMLVISASYRNFDDAFACGGGLGVGFPISFLCDYATGGSPINSWGRVDLSDFPYFSLTGLFVDSLFYAAILGIGWLARLVLRQNDRFPAGNLLWGAIAATAFLIGFLAASAIFKADRVNFHDYILGIPSPVPATSTPVGTPPP